MFSGSFVVFYCHCVTDMSYDNGEFADFIRPLAGWADLQQCGYEVIDYVRCNFIQSSGVAVSKFKRGVRQKESLNSHISERESKVHY